jgi:hypothetical protein
MTDPVKIRLLGQRGSIAIWQVDGNYIRRRLNTEFTNYGQHYHFRFIPENEVWIDQEAVPDETEFFITHLLVERRLMASGVPYDQALAVANGVEHTERLKAGDIPFDLPLSPEALEAIHVKPFIKFLNGVTVWLVDGRKIRSGIDPDFTEGGHGLVYKYIPENEIWLDNDLIDEELGFVFAHEWIERKLMLDGKKYESAHRTASIFENAIRAFPAVLAQLPKILKEEPVNGPN